MRTKAYKFKGFINIQMFIWSLDSLRREREIERRICIRMHFKHLTNDANEDEYVVYQKIPIRLLLVPIQFSESNKNMPIKRKKNEENEKKEEVEVHS